MLSTLASISILLSGLLAADAASEWKLESITLKDGVSFHGLILAERDDLVEFAEIVRPPGKPMFVVIRPVDPESIAAIVHLPEQERQQLAKTIDQLRRRARIEAGRMQDIVLRREGDNQNGRWIYQGDWFRLESTTDEEMTRRSVVRVEQIFRAYRLILPPSVSTYSDLRILLFGAMDDYRRFVRETGLQIVNPAFYSASKNLIVAGSDLNAYVERLTSVRLHHAQVRQRYKQLDRDFTNRLAPVVSEMKRNGYSSAEIEQETRLRRSVWQREYESALDRIEVAERQNDARYAEITDQMFARLYHEAFHAYVQEYVYPDDATPLPRWLNEGLAQIFETSQLDDDTLRIDAPDLLSLGNLQEELARGDALRLIEVLSAEDNEFMNAHRVGTGQRVYLYAWGLAYHLVYNQNLLQGKQLDQYVTNPRGLDAEARFSDLVGRPLREFEVAWRKAMLDLR